MKERTRRRSQVLRLLKDADEPLSVAMIAAQLGIHPNTARFHLDALERLGQIEQVASPRRTPGRPPQLFRPVPRMDPTGPRNYRALAEVLADALSAEADSTARAIETGRTWGHRAAAQQPGNPDDIDRLVGLLDEFGFEPERIDGAATTTIGLHNCPFLEVAEHRRDIVCGVHLGLMRGALEQWGSQADVRRLTPFAQPQLCVAEVAGPPAQ
ncbi:helix-turn-helix transcriptional regulator [Microbacterium sp.]|uniref:helix-turn-helix transcriptional regulator n=1 Tax=Microbacterium sp. TaxID=51671 RepID=UPI0037C5283B